MVVIHLEGKQERSYFHTVITAYMYKDIKAYLYVNMRMCLCVNMCTQKRKNTYMDVCARGISDVTRFSPSFEDDN